MRRLSDESMQTHLQCGGCGGGVCVCVCGGGHTSPLITVMLNVNACLCVCNMKICPSVLTRCFNQHLCLCSNSYEGKTVG